MAANGHGCLVPGTCGTVLESSVLCDFPWGVRSELNSTLVDTPVSVIKLVSSEATMRYRLYITTNTGTRCEEAESLSKAKSCRSEWMKISGVEKIEVWYDATEIKDLRWTLR